MQFCVGAIPNEPCKSDVRNRISVFYKLDPLISNYWEIFSSQISFILYISTIDLNSYQIWKFFYFTLLHMKQARCFYRFELLFKKIKKMQCQTLEKEIPRGRIGLATCLNLYSLNGLIDWCTQVPEFWLAENFIV